MKKQRGLRIFIFMTILTAIFSFNAIAIAEDAPVVDQPQESVSKSESSTEAPPEPADLPEDVPGDAPEQQQEASAPHESQRERNSAKAPAPPPPPAPKPTAEEKAYIVKWAPTAFSAQTTNYEDQVVLGVDANHALDLQRDILITLNGKQHSHKGVRLNCASSNENTLYVSADGLIKGKQRGTAQLIVSLEFPDGQQRQLRKHVKVVAAPRIRFAPGQSVLENGGTLDLSQYARVPLLMASPNVNADVRYELEAIRNDHQSTVDLDANSGKLSVHYDLPGDVYVVTAHTYSGETATFTLLLGDPKPTAIVSWPQDTLMDDEGYAHLTQGDGCELVISVLDENGEPVDPNGSWLIDGAGTVTIDDDNNLAIESADAGDVYMLTYTDDIGATASLYLMID